MKPDELAHFKCESCDNAQPESLMCEDCWQDLRVCGCLYNLQQWDMKILCGQCGESTLINLVEIDKALDDEEDEEDETEDKIPVGSNNYYDWWDDDDDEFEWGDDMLGWKKKETKPLTVTGNLSKAPATKKPAPIMKCRHYNIPIEIAKGVVVYPSSMNNDSPTKRSEDKDPNVIVPDFGLYADSGWRPAWRNEFVTFPDFGIPKYDVAITQITEAAERAASGERIELGCIGGHGRTGTMLACMFLWGAERDSVPISATEACELVWYFYCDKAIETDEQEWWVSYYAHHQFGHELAEKPKPKPPQKWSGKSGPLGWTGGGVTKDSGIVCQPIDHLEMIAAGAKKCLAVDNCQWWEEDSAPGVTVAEDLRQANIAKYKQKIAQQSIVVGKKVGDK